jgi:hypothetical protein
VAFRDNQRGRLRFLLKHIPPPRFLSEFVPAEFRYQPSAIRGQESVPLRLAYLAAIPMAASVLRQYWQADDGTIAEVLRALQWLYRQAWDEDWRKTEDAVSATTSALPSPAAAPEFPAPSLREFEFRSRLPIIGPLIARFRAFWYGIAAQWAVQDLIRQQDALNQRLNGRQEEYTRALEGRIATLAEENAFLAGEIARLLLNR